MVFIFFLAWRNLRLCGNSGLAAVRYCFYLFLILLSSSAMAEGSFYFAGGFFSSTSLGVCKQVFPFNPNNPDYAVFVIGSNCCLSNTGGNSCSGGWTSLMSTACPSGSAPFKFKSGYSCTAIPSKNGFSDILALAGAAVGLAILGGIGAAIGAPVLTGLAVAGLFHTAVGGVLTYNSGGTAQNNLNSLRTPLSVSLVPVSNPSPPSTSSTVTPSVSVDADSGLFIPNGRLAAGPGAPGWSASSSEDWIFTPDPTVGNLLPFPVAKITDGGATVVQQVSASSSGGSDSSVAVTRLIDGSTIIARSAVLPVSTSSGVSTTVAATSSTAYAPSGEAVSGPVVAVADTLGNGQPSNGGADLNIPGGGTAPGTGAASGGCSGANCASESTQLANKSFLQSISEFFSGVQGANVDPVALTRDDIKGVGLTGSNVFNGLRDWTLPSHSSQCPTSSFGWNNQTFTFDAHCRLVDDHFSTFRNVMILLFSVSALFVVLKA